MQEKKRKTTLSTRELDKFVSSKYVLTMREHNRPSIALLMEIDSMKLLPREKPKTLFHSMTMGRHNFIQARLTLYNNCKKCVRDARKVIIWWFNILAMEQRLKMRTEMKRVEWTRLSA